MVVVFSILGLVVIGLITYCDWENPDKKSISWGSIDRESVRLNNERKNKQIARLEEKVRALNHEYPQRSYYRDGARIKQHTSEEVAEIEVRKIEHERLKTECNKRNAPYASHQKHYLIKDGAIVHIGEAMARQLKFEEKMRLTNRDPNNGIRCHIDHQENKLIDSRTKEEIPFNPNEYTLTGETVNSIM